MFNWFRKLFHRRKKEIKFLQPAMEKTMNEFIKHPKRFTNIPKAGHQAVNQDVSKFMKHGRQSPLYRKSIKAKVKPEEEN